MTTATLPNLHDASLSTVVVSWAELKCSFELALVNQSRGVLVFVGVRDLHLPHRDPWGPSESVNALRFPNPGEFEIEMQSGDSIRVEAERCEWKGGAHAL